MFGPQRNLHSRLQPVLVGSVGGRSAPCPAAYAWPGVVLCQQWRGALSARTDVRDAVLRERNHTWSENL